jgi:hypothetical protein
MKRVLGTLLLLACASGLGQEFRATILGEVRDPSGAAIPNAVVRAT